MLPRMSIGQWFKNLFSGGASRHASPEVAHQVHEEKTIVEARVDAGGGGAFWPDSHANPGEEAGMAEKESE